MSRHEGRPFSGFSRSFGVVRSLPISLVGLSRTGSGSGSLRIGTLLPALTLLVALLAIVPTFHVGLCLPAFGATLTPPSCGGYGTTVGTTHVLSLLLLSAATSAYRSASVYNIQLSD